MKQSICIQSVCSIGLALVLSACSPAANSEQATPKKQTTSQISMSQSHADILQIIEAGHTAKKNMDANAMTDAARLLTRLGAQPFNKDMPDLAKDWRTTANTLQGTKNDPAYRGRVRGPAYREMVLAPGGEEVLQEIYYASERAELTLKIIDGSALALRVAEQAETATDAVCTLSAKIKAASCQWLPLWTAKYDITIVNHGDSPVSYLLVTN